MGLRLTPPDPPHTHTPSPETLFLWFYWNSTACCCFLYCLLLVLLEQYRNPVMFYCKTYILLRCSLVFVESTCFIKVCIVSSSKTCASYNISGSISISYHISPYLHTAIIPKRKRMHTHEVSFLSFLSGWGSECLRDETPILRPLELEHH